MSIALYCPSRGRPQEAKALRESFLATIALDTKLVFLVDHDDPTANSYPLPVILGEPTGDPTGPLNVAVRASAADIVDGIAIVGFIGDDSRCLTPGWDVLVTRALETTGYCWGDDGHDLPWPSTCFVTTDIIRALGYFVPPALRRGYFDWAWVDLAKGAGCARVIPARFPHDNSRGDPAAPNFDPAFQVPPEVIARDGEMFKVWSALQLPQDVRTLRHLIYR